MPLNLTTADAALKEFYLPGARAVLNSEIFLLSQLDMNSEDIEGRRAVLSINTARNAGIGARADGGTLPTAGNQGYAEERVPLRYNYGRIQISGPTIRAMNSDKGSFVRAIKSEMDGVVRDLKNDVNRQCYGTSNGVIANAASVAGQVVTLNANTTTTALRQIEQGMVLDIGTVANPTLRSTAVVVSSVDTVAKTVTFVGTVTGTTTTDFLFRSGSGGSGAAQKELTGLGTIVASSGTLFNIDPAVNLKWASYVDANGGTNRAVAESMFTKASMEVNIRSGEQINLWVTTDGVQRGLATLMQSLRRFPVPVELKSGYKGIDMSNAGQGQTGSNEVVLTYDKDCTGNTAYALTTKRMQQYVMSDWEFMDEDGAVLSRVAGVDAYEATLFKYHEIATDARNAHGKISDLTET